LPGQVEVKQITAIELQKRNKERVNVFLDGEYAFSISALEAVRLRKGQSLSDDEIAAMRGEDAVGKAVDSAARFLSYRPRSEAEIRRNLASKSIDEPIIDAALERLRTMGYLNDQAFARFWVENRTAFKPLGPSALRHELRQKGIADADIEAVLGDIDVQDSAYRAALAQSRRLRGSDRRTFRHRIGSFLQRRGFNYAVIEDVMSRLMEELTSLDDDFFASDKSRGEDSFEE
jgi:regulatory protein